ncbi:hypothetical protein DEO72_LG2g2057 [Vigna unguiculata]|uniref:Transmembrane protein n=1 Tax=Vigna unguiculata TaxID=3917 RepID=A0A4D6KZ39_VIGUN|nr:hypothetical protein DEO72_LG2g2057 [Vigna unguiculata]
MQNCWKEIPHSIEEFCGECHVIAVKMTYLTLSLQFIFPILFIVHGRVIHGGGGAGFTGCCVVVVGTLMSWWRSSFEDGAPVVVVTMKPPTTVWAVGDEVSP